MRHPGRGCVEEGHQTKVVDPQEVVAIAAAMPPRHRAMVLLAACGVVGDPKSEAGKRRVAIPPHLLAESPAAPRRAHRRRPASLFSARQDSAAQMQPSTLYKVFYPAREAAGRPDLALPRPRYTATLAARAGATGRPHAAAGHSTPGAAMRYQHAGVDRDRLIAEALSEAAPAKIIALRPADSA